MTGRTIDQAEEAGKDPASILRASNLSVSEPWEEVKTAYERMVAGGVGYLVIPDGSKLSRAVRRSSPTSRTPTTIHSAGTVR
jgi:hypothetical protein